ncbi:27749_t:CDS:2 [Dentiscutata erythropus]|uniref:27749_t:CDS:1 n=1 Tax=Dentiscutata erythropus TaxID=1348616 RepID=A0A9N9JQ19_9GLOM|nr:27749_t:CDS:2 [Dentiscutata erythropus]
MYYLVIELDDDYQRGLEEPGNTGVVKEDAERITHLEKIITSTEDIEDSYRAMVVWKFVQSPTEATTHNSSSMVDDVKIIDRSIDGVDQVEKANAKRNSVLLQEHR